MSEHNPPGDEPTQAYSAYNDDATRMERPIQPYDSPQMPPLYAEPAVPGVQPRGPGIVAPLVTVALLSILLGIGLGYLLFHSNDDSGTSSTSTTTTAVSAVVPSTSSSTAASSTTTSEASTSTSRKATTTTTTVRSTTTTTAAKTTSTTARATTSTTEAG